jgi:hypothetical protein
MCRFLNFILFASVISSALGVDSTSNRPKSRKQATITSTLSLISQIGGTITPAYDGASLEVGKSYTVKATALPGYSFVDWSGTVSTNTNPLTFVMTSNALLQANFVMTNPFPVLKGTFNGLFYPSNTAAINNAGFLTLNLTKSGRFSGKLLLSGQSLGFASAFDSSGNALINVSSPSGPLQLALALDTSAHTVNGSIVNNSWVAQFRAVRGTALANLIGHYTLMISGSSDSTTSPPGVGVGTATFGKNGSVTIVGTLADGSAFTQHILVGEDGEVPFCVSVGKGAELILGWLRCDTEQTAMWIKSPNSQSVLYKPGFFLTPQVVLAKYSAPVGKQPAVWWTNGSVTLTGGNLQSNCINEVICQNNSFKSIAGPITNLLLTVTPKTGLIKGTCTHQSTGKRIQLRGTLLQNPGGRYSLYSGGWFVGTSEGGFIGLAGPISIPQVAPASDLCAIGFTANWSGVPAADGFRVDVSTNSDFSTFVLHDQVAIGSNYNVTGLASGTAYFYRVRAVGSGAVSDNSATIVTTTLVPTPISTNTIGLDGGTITAPSDSDLDGVVLQVPAGAYSNACDFALSSSPVTAANLPLGTDPVIPLIHIQNGGVQAGAVMTLTVPCVLGKDETAFGWLLNEATGSWEALPTWTSDNSVTVATRHFSYIAIAKARISTLLTQIATAPDSHFRPGIDDWEFVNNGSFPNKGGDCEGMSQSAMWYFLNQ